MKNILKVLACRALTVLLIFSTGCSYIAPGNTEKELATINSIGVLPAHIVNRQPSKVKAGAMAELNAGTEIINSLLADYFQGFQDVSLISQSEIEGLSSAEPGIFLHLAREAGRQLHYDAVLITSVERYQARDGSEYAVITPASVAFSLKLLAVKSGQVVWSADFDQTQQPLFENILPSTRSTGSGFRWLTAEELTSAGLTKKLDSSPYLNKD
jgi:hypothetical protein